MVLPSLRVRLVVQSVVLAAISLWPALRSPTTVAVFASHERELIRERVTAGVRRAQAAGRHVGRPRALVPVDAAVALLGDGRGLREVAGMLHVNRNVLRDRLRESGAWPVPARVETPVPA